MPIFDIPEKLVYENTWRIEADNEKEAKALLRRWLDGGNIDNSVRCISALEVDKSELKDPMKRQRCPLAPEIPEHMWERMTKLNLE